MMQTLREFLREYAKNLPDQILDGRIRRVLTNPDHTRLFFETEFDRTVPFSELSAFETELAERLSLQSARLLCRYPAEAFSVAVLPDLFLSLRRDLPLINGFLEGADLSFENGVLSVGLKQGGVDILERTHFREELARAIQAIYSVTLTVEFSGGNPHISEEAFNKMQSDVLAELPPNRTEMPQEKPRESDTPVFSALTPDIKQIQPEMPAKSDLSVIYGRAVREKPLPISEVVQQIGNSAGAKKFSVAAEIFAKPESRQLKNGKTIVSFPVTDYTGSLLVKLFLD